MLRGVAPRSVSERRAIAQNEASFFKLLEWSPEQLKRGNFLASFIKGFKSGSARALTSQCKRNVYGIVSALST